MQDQFDLQVSPVRIVFGDGSISRTAEMVRYLGCARAFVLSTPQQKDQADELSESIGELSAGVYACATMHTPVEVTEDALKSFEAACSDSSSPGLL